MKNFLKIAIVMTATFTIGIMQVFALGANNQMAAAFATSSNPDAISHAYLEKAKAIRAEINSYTAQIKEMNEYNKSINQKLKVINEQYKKDKNSFSSDKLKQIKALRKSIEKREKNEQTVTEDNSVKSLVQNKEYDKALARLNEILEAKKEQLKVVQERNAIWRQIDALIG